MTSSNRSKKSTPNWKKEKKKGDKRRKKIPFHNVLSKNPRQITNTSLIATLDSLLKPKSKPKKHILQI